MLWPRISLRGNGAAPAAVSPEEIREVLLATRLFMADPASGISSHINHWLTGTGPPARTAENLRQVVEDLARGVPCYRIPVEGDPAALAARIKDLLTRIPPATTQRSPT
jgi:hypothetical protein